MRDQEIERILGEEREIVASPGFHASVMRAVRREAATPPPIPFPWKRAWPAFIASAIALVASPFVLVDPGPLLPVAESIGAPWIALAAVATAGSLLLTRHLAQERY